MSRRKRNILFFIAVAVAVGATAFWLSFRPSRDKGKKVLVVFSERKKRYAFTDYEAAIARGFERKGLDVDFIFTYLDCEKYEDEAEKKMARQIVETEAQKQHLDLIVSIGDQMTYSLMASGTHVLDSIPMVFGGVAFPNWKLIAKHKNVTGVSDSIDVAENIKLATLFSGQANTFTILDSTFLDRKSALLINEQLKGRTDILNNLDWQYSVREILDRGNDKYSITPLSLRYLATNTKVTEPLSPRGANNLQTILRRFMHLTYVQVNYAPVSTRIIRFNSQRPKVSAICMDFGASDNDYITGYFSSPDDIADGIARCAGQVLAGVAPSSIKIVPSEKHYFVDWHVMERYKYTIDDIPEGFTAINLSWAEHYRSAYIVIVSFFVMGLMIVVVILSRMYWKARKKTKAAEKQHEHDNVVIRMAVDNNNSYVWERNGTTMHFNSSFWRMIGMKKRPIELDEYTSMMTPESREEYMDLVDQVSTGGSCVKEIQADFLGKGVYHWYKVQSQGVADEDGNFVRAYGLLTNIDDFKCRERELEEARRMAEEATLKESFLANMSHEIRTPLNAIVGFSNLLLQPDADFTDEDKKLFAETIKTNNDLLLKLINDILDLSRVESGQMDFVFKDYSVRTIVEKVHATFTVQMPKHLEFRLVQPDDDATVHLDESRLRQVISNFLTNAGKFTTKGSVTLGWEHHYDVGQVELYVEDTGIGLSEEDRTMVFSRFYKKDEFKQGTGLGLSICKAIVIRMGGKIKVKSELGKGSRFSVFFKEK